jgi:DNA-binding MarR family transcriptional regulator
VTDITQIAVAPAERAAERQARRLDDGEMAVWLPVIRLVQLLPQALDKTLREETGVNHAHYAILVTLAQAGQSPATMGELAQIAGLSRSRLSHAIDALAARGWVERIACPSDRRAARAVLTEAGRDALRESAPTHVAQIRELILDRLDAAERAQLAALVTKLLPGVERSV